MADISKEVEQPVAYPDKFLGAPFLPAFASFIFCMISMISCFAFRGSTAYGYIFLGAFPVLHVTIIGLGMKEPHLTTLMQTYYLTKVAPRNVGHKARKYRCFYPD